MPRPQAMAEMTEALHAALPELQAEVSALQSSGFSQGFMRLQLPFAGIH